jgi:hypothetical protein
MLQSTNWTGLDCKDAIRVSGFLLRHSTVIYVSFIAVIPGGQKLFSSLSSVKHLQNIN